MASLRRIYLFSDCFEQHQAYTCVAGSRPVGYHQHRTIQLSLTNGNASVGNVILRCGAAQRGTEVSFVIFKLEADGSCEEGGLALTLITLGTQICTH